VKRLILLPALLAAVVCTPVVGFAEESSKTEKSSASESEVKYWITSTGKRHNSSCSYYGTTKTGRYTTNKEEGSPCKKCGG
jgi:ADP-heptose:LPS heptosyltransferase